MWPRPPFVDHPFYATKKPAAVPALSAVSRDASALTKRWIRPVQNLGEPWDFFYHATIHDPASVIYIYIRINKHVSRSIACNVIFNELCNVLCDVLCNVVCNVTVLQYAMCYLMSCHVMLCNVIMLWNAMECNVMLCSVSVIPIGSWIQEFWIENFGILNPGSSTRHAIDGTAFKGHKRSKFPFLALDKGVPWFWNLHFPKYVSASVFHSRQTAGYYLPEYFSCMEFCRRAVSHVQYLFSTCIPLEELSNLVQLQCTQCSFWRVIEDSYKGAR